MEIKGKPQPQSQPQKAQPSKPAAPPRLVRTKRGTARLTSKPADALHTQTGKGQAAGLALPGSEKQAQDAARQAIATGQPEPAGMGGILDTLKHAPGNVLHGIEQAPGDVVHVVKGIPGEVKHVVSTLPASAQTAALGITFDKFKTLRDEKDPGDVNSPDLSEVEQAKNELKQNAAAEKSALDRLPEGDRKKYETVRDTVKQQDTDENTLGQRALQKMLLDGRLTAQKDTQGQGNLLDHLATMAKQPVASGISNSSLVAETASEVENPMRIDQQQRNTCGAATAQILLARKNPAEYARVIGGLASPEGKVELAGGAEAQRASDWQADDGGRSTPSRLLQPPLMNLGQLLPGEKYSNSNDIGTLGGHDVPGSSGLMAWGEARINSQLEGTHYQSHIFKRWDRDENWNKVKDAIAQGKGPIPTGITYNDGSEGAFGHYVQVDKVEDGRVYFTNPWGKQQSLAEDEYKAHVYDAHIPD